MSLTSKIDRDLLKNARKQIKTAHITMHIGSLAAGMEALEEILVEKGILERDELMARLEKVLQKHYERGELISEHPDA